MILLVAAWGVWKGVRCNAPRTPVRPREAALALWDAKWDLGLPTLVIVAVTSGFATVTEAAALAAAYAIVVELLIFRSIHPFRDLPRVLVHASALVGSVLILLGSALGVTSWFVDAEVPTRLVEWMTAHVRSPALFLLMLNAVLLVLGSVLEIYSAIVVLAPLVAPLGQAYGIEPIHLGVVFLANLELGFLFPPMGLNLFLSALAVREAAAVGLPEGVPVPAHHVGRRPRHHLPAGAHDGRRHVLRAEVARGRSSGGGEHGTERGDQRAAHARVVRAPLERSRPARRGSRPRARPRPARPPRGRPRTRPRPRGAPPRRPPRAGARPPPTS